MLYAIERTDGGVSIMRTYPVQARELATDRTFKVEGIRRENSGSYKIFLRLDDQPAVLEGITDAELLEDRAPGWQFITSDPKVKVAQWSKGDRDAVVSIRRIASTDVPKDRTFRNAWKPDLTHDMPKAREIWR